mgnify:FL=1
MADVNAYALSVQLSLDSSDAFASMQDFADTAVHMEQQFAKAGKAGTKTIDDQVDLFSDIHDSLKSKNLLHNEQNEYLEEDIRLAGKSNDKFGIMKDSVDDVAIGLGRGVSFIWSMLEGIAAATQITEDFKDANYRAYGGIEQLTIGANLLSNEMDVLGSEGRAAYKALADIRTPRDEIGKLAGAIAVSSRETGVGADNLATYVRMMRATGTTGDQAAASVAGMTEMMRKNGLTAGDMNRIVGDTAVSAGLLNMMFGEGAAVDFTKLKGDLDGLAKSMGLAADTGSQMMNSMMNDTHAMTMMQEASGVAIHSVESMGLAFAKQANNVSSQIERLTVSADGVGPSAVAAQRELQVLAKSFGFVNADAMAMSHNLNKMAKEMGITIKTQEDYNTVLAAAQAEMRSNETASESFNRQFALIKDKMQSALTSILILIGQALIPLMKVLIAIITPITWVIQKISSLISWVMNLASSLGVIGDVINTVIAGLLLFGAYVLYTGGAVGTAMGAIGGAFAWFGTIVTSVFGTVGTALTGFSAKVMAIASRMATSLGGVLAKFGLQIAPAIIPLLGLAGAMMMVAAAAWIFAQAVKVLADVGWRAIPAMIGFALAIVVVGLSLWALAASGYVAGPPLLFVAGAMMMMAAAAWIFAQALVIAAGSIGLFAESMDKISMGAAAKIGAVVLLLALSLALAGPWLSAAAMIFVPAAIGIGFGLYLLGVGLTRLAAALGASKNVTSELFDVSLALLMAAPMLAYAGVPFLIGATLVGVGAMILGFGLKLLGSGLKASKGLGGELFDISYAIMAASPMLFVAGVYFIIGATLVGVGAMILGLGLKWLADGTKGMKDVDLVSIADQLMRASPALYLAGFLFTGAAMAVGIGAMFLGYGLKLLGDGAKNMKDVDLVSVAQQLMAASIPLWSAAIPLYFAGQALFPASIMLWLAGKVIGSIGKEMVTGAKNLAEAGIYLVAAGNDMIKAGPTLFIGSAYLLTAAVILGVAGIALIPASLALVAGALSLYYGVKMLLWAIGDFVKQSDNIMKMAIGLDLLGKAMITLGKIEMKQIASEIEDALAGVNKLGDLADKLQSVAAKFKSAATALKAPVNAIATIFNQLNSSLDGFHRNVQNISSDVDQLTSSINNHVGLMENAADRINVAVGAKVAPAMSEAERVGINDAVRAETIQQVQVAVTTEGEAAGADNQIVLLSMMRDQLVSLNANVAKIGGTSAVNEIYELCARYLPGMAGKSEGLSSELNEYMS